MSDDQSGLSPDYTDFIRDLRTLPPNINPWQFLANAFNEILSTKQPKAKVVVLYVCAGLWTLSLFASVYSLYLRFKRGERWVIKRAKTKYGTFFLPNTAILYPIVELCFFFTTEWSVALLIKNSLGQPATRGTYSVWKLNWIFFFIGAWIQAYSCATSAVIIHASRKAVKKRKWVAMAVTLTGLVILIAIVAVLVFFLAAQVVWFLRFISILRETIAEFSTLASTWTEGTDISQQARGTLPQLFAAITLPGDRVSAYILGFNVAYLIMISILLVTWVPAAWLQVSNLRLQLKHAQAKIDQERLAEHQLGQSTTDGKRKKSKALKQLVRLKAMCRNVILSTLAFVILAAALVPVGALLIHRTQDGDIASLKDFDDLQFISVVEFTLILIPIDLFLLQRTRLAGKLANNSKSLQSSAETDKTAVSEKTTATTPTTEESVPVKTVPADDPTRDSDDEDSVNTWISSDDETEYESDEEAE